MNKICITCGAEKDISNFRYCKTCKDGHYNQCNSCRNSVRNKYRKNSTKYRETERAYKIKNREKLNLQSVLYSKNNPEKRKKSQQKYITLHIDKVRESRRRYVSNNVEKVRAKSREWAKNNKARMCLIARKRRLNVNFRITDNLRGRVYKLLKKQNVIKDGHTIDLVGCSVSKLREHIESKFLPTMTWENYGSYWHIDHIIPCIAFDLTKKEEQKRCFNYTNLQPLFSTTQIINGTEYIGNLNKHTKVL